MKDTSSSKLTKTKGNFETVTEEQTEKIFKNFDSMALLKDIIAVTDFPKPTVKDKIDNEVEYLGYTTITDQRFDKEDWYILDTLGTYNNIYLLFCPGMLLLLPMS